MHDNFDQLQNLFVDSPHVPLTDTERAHMRALLSEYAALKPPPAHSPSRTHALLHALLPRGKNILAAAAAACCVLASTGVAFAAEGSLPGSLLYGIKVNVVEPIQTAFVFTPQAQATWQETLAMRRLNEAVTLASKGDLSTSTEERLAVRFSTSARAAINGAEAQQAQDPGEAAVLSTAFSGQLAGYQDIFARLGTEYGDHTRTLISAIQAHETENQSSSALAFGQPTEHAAVMRPAATGGIVHGPMRPLAVSVGSISSATPPAAPTVESTSTVHVAARMQSAAIDALETASQLITDTESSIGSTTAAQARLRLSAAQDAVQRGDALLREHDAAGAAGAFSSALGISTRIGVLVRAARTLKIDAFSPRPVPAQGNERSTSAPATNDVSGTEANVTPSIRNTGMLQHASSELQTQTPHATEPATDTHTTNLHATESIYATSTVQHLEHGVSLPHFDL